MENRRKILSFLTPFYVVFLLHHLVVTVAGALPSPYTPTESIFIACGLSGISRNTLENRIWIGDVNSKYSPLEPQRNASRTFSLQQELPYLASRVSHSQFTYSFNITAGQKFIRLYFYSFTYPDFNSSKDFFSVSAGSFTLLRNFSVSLHANALGENKVFKEFCINIEEDQKSLNITFNPSPDYQDSYAVISGIEIISMPSSLYFTAADDPGLVFVGQGNQYNIRSSNALATLYRINVGGNFISPQKDTGMYRKWDQDVDYVTDERPGALPVNSSIVLSFSEIRNYSAPIEVYTTARTMGTNKTINENYDLTWEFEVDSGFTYFVRLHFCEFQIEITKVGDRVFRIYIANQTVQAEADVLAWSGGNGVPIYKDYAVMTGSKGNEKKQNLSIKLHPTPEWRTKYSDAILNGLEIFKVDNNGDLAGPNPDSRINAPLDSLPSPTSTKRKNHRAAIIGIISGVSSGFVVLSLLLLLIFRRARKVKDSSFNGGTSFWGPIFSSTAKSRKSLGSSLPSDLCTHFSLSEIKAATNNFDNVLIIGVGGFGNVYKGYINSGSTPVAIKRLNPGSQQGAQEFQTEIGMLSQLRHLHLVSLIGFCNDDREMILVYDFMARGTLRDHLYNSDNPPLPWNQRLEICIGAARGLHYLHTGTNHVIIHRDVKTTNILLDDKWVAKVSDFGLSKFGPTSMSKTHVSTIVKGSIGYLDPEYYRRQHLTEKSDVYSCGIVLFEVLCARPPILRTAVKKQVSLAAWAQQCYRNGTIDEIIDPFLKGKIKLECLNKYAEVAMSCLNDKGIKRPSMSDVVWGLEFALQLQGSAEEIEMEEILASKHINDETDDSAAMFSSIGEHVLESKGISTITISTADEDQSLSTRSSGSRPLTKAVFSEIMNPEGR
ncbi:Receptor-like protein kinase [Melia azedarach]|uniref:Receptor-like protein kinase n=1 Tax=Melia azedarach TaxID=155640 RepID=A0ACC1X821_MELAZ|nr:Receptor-like protein kinase [Melia azedarach]